MNFGILIFSTVTFSLHFSKNPYFWQFLSAWDKNVVPFPSDADKKFTEALFKITMCFCTSGVREKLIRNSSNKSGQNKEWKITHKIPQLKTWLRIQRTDSKAAKNLGISREFWHILWTARPATPHVKSSSFCNAPLSKAMVYDSRELLVS